MNSVSKLVFVFAAMAVTFAAVPQQPLPPASFIIEARDAATNQPLPSFGGLRTGQVVNLTVKAFDRFGQEIQNCAPVVQPIQGFTGGQIDPLVQTGPSTFRMTAGAGFGSAELEVFCAAFPNIKHKEFVAVTNTLQPPRAAAAPGEAAGPGPQAVPQAEQTVPIGDGAQTGGGAGNAGAGAGTALAIGAVAAGVGLAAVIAAAAASGTDGDSCPSYSDCCPGGSGGGCGVPADCSCPSGTTDQGICNSAGCGGFIGIGNRSCTCN